MSWRSWLGSGVVGLVLVSWTTRTPLSADVSVNLDAWSAWTPGARLSAAFTSAPAIDVACHEPVPPVFLGLVDHGLRRRDAERMAAAWLGADGSPLHGLALLTLVLHGDAWADLPAPVTLHHVTVLLARYPDAPERVGRYLGGIAATCPESPP